ncbi:nucleoside triphosphate pyrophosphohydrolase [Lutimonas zeaxanthinifaciens]|uniref:nucleoside triphosphate pyrophosphohydrolase n=1 Tax=Lutimonas zeaxanthinifaciens TaxID=3060215 RepID=UPI00265C9AF4|nr:nucleoside triphosphate pyrophosphohydrolase [Lutimonas sp. YSD2104]WKK64937.1 nucleoside triphosphate pyrophosphohydrolase [Lutimonas sp. YSD2104]
MTQREMQLKAFGDLLDIMDELREKCPWDRKQTMESLRHLTIEETYELADAILDKDYQEVSKELGDLMLHIVFYAKIGSESNDFNILDVIKGINQKLIDRHPHVFGDVVAETDEEVAKNWEQLKLKEGKKSILEGVPKSLPALVKASRIQDKAASAGFDWDRSEQVFEKVQEEIEELYTEVQKKDTSKIEAEFGDVLFSLINYARFIDVDPESALERTNKKFIKRFQYLEKEVSREGKDLRKLSLEEMDVYWDRSKAYFK